MVLYSAPPRILAVWLSLRHPHSPPRSFHVSYSSSIATPTSRPFSGISHPPSDFFEYTSGRWIFNDELRHAERRRVFKVDELSRLAAESVNRSPDDIARMEKLSEGGYNRTFLITMRCGFQMLACIPYPATVPKYLAVASEVATMAYLRSFGLPIPDVYGYSPTPNNAAGTEYIFMEFVQGTKLSDIWYSLGEEEIISITRQLAELKSKMTSIVFPAGGSLYYTEDLENVAGSASGSTRPGITLEDKRFCVGPDTNLSLWYGRRSQLDLDRGPYKNVEAALVRGAEKELAYLRQFGRPLLPFQRIRRAPYNYQEQPPSDHIENLDRYLRIAPLLIPKNPAFTHFLIRHPDLQPGNITVSRSFDSNLYVVGLIGWQRTSILPMFLLAGIPQRLQNCDDISLQSMWGPLLQGKLDDLDKTQQRRELEFHCRRLAHFNHVRNTEEYNELHYAASTEPTVIFRRHLFRHASNPWKGDSLALKVALIQATKNWKMLTGRGQPCPIVFDPDDVRKTMVLDAELRLADEILEGYQYKIFFGPGGWVPNEHYEKAMARSKKLKEDSFASAMAESKEAQALIAAHWHLDDMDEEEYM